MRKNQSFPADSNDPGTALFRGIYTYIAGFPLLFFAGLLSCLLYTQPTQAQQRSSVSHTDAASLHWDSLRNCHNDLALLQQHQAKNLYPDKKKPTFLLIGDKNWVKYNPVNLAFGGLLFIYQSVISSQIAADCPYEISCSNFSKQSLQEFGLIKGLALSADRVMRCTKIAVKNVHPLRINEKGMLIDPPAFYRKQVVN